MHDLVEEVARAVFDGRPHNVSVNGVRQIPDWDIQPEHLKDVFRRDAAIAIAIVVRRCAEVAGNFEGSSALERSDDPCAAVASVIEARSSPSTPTPAKRIRDMSAKVRRRRYDQWPQPLIGWFDERLSCFCDATNHFYKRDYRMISWRRPL